jgi:hypothetical protein
MKKESSRRKRSAYRRKKQALETRCLFNCSQAQEKRGTMAGLAFAPDRSAHFLGQFLGQGQPVTG